MFKGKHYVPILRWKQAEWEAVGDLEAQDRKSIVPLFELLPKSFQATRSGPRKGILPRPEAVFSQIAKDVLQYWGNEPFFFDLQHIQSMPVFQGLHPIIRAAKELRVVRSTPIWVSRLSDTQDVRSAMRSVLDADADNDKKGVCLRVLISEIESEGFPERVVTHLRSLGCDHASADLLIDYRAIQRPCGPTFPNLFERIPDIRKFRTLIVASGAFPENLTKFRPDRHEIPREDWIFYRDQVLEDRLARGPLFSDYTIQFGIYKEPPENSNPSASIRYTFGDVWVVMRGEGLRNKEGPKNEQYPEEARLICEGNEFCGASFSAGDAYLYEKFLKVGGPGTPQTWLRAGICHHMTYVIRQFAEADLRAIPRYRGDRPVESVRPAIRI